MDELIKTLANDVRIVEQQRSKMEPFSNMEVGLYGRAYGFKVALGRAILTDNGIDPTNVDKAIILADDYLLHN